MTWPLTPFALLTGLQLLVLAPVLEELVFRTGLQQALLARGWGAQASALGVAVVFAAAHCALRGPSWLAVATLLPAWLLGWVYARWRRVLGCMAGHAAFNLMWWGWRWWHGTF